MKKRTQQRRKVISTKVNSNALKIETLKMTVGDNGYGTTEHALKSAHDALWAIANMQITENTDKGEVLALCMSIARLELEKCSTAGK